MDQELGNPLIRKWNAILEQKLADDLVLLGIDDRGSAEALLLQGPIVGEIAGVIEEEGSTAKDGQDKRENKRIDQANGETSLLSLIRLAWLMVFSFHHHYH
jgi:hypothetical protein